MLMSAKIEITSSCDGESVSLTCDGTVRCENGTTYVEYDGDNNAHTCIGISPDIVTLNRMGDLDYTMILEEGKTNSFDLGTPEGTLRFSVNTKKIRQRIQNDALRLWLVYVMNGLPHIQTETSLKLKCDFIKETATKQKIN